MTKVTNLTERRKEEHIDINLEEDVQFPNLTTGFERFRFIHQALPEIDIAEIDTSINVFGKTLQTPVFISSMTGGTEKAQNINRNLAEAAQIRGMAMGLGSQRAAIEDPGLVASYNVRPIAPDILLFANIGAVQLNYGYTAEHCQRAVDMIEADALILHLNALQEAVQPEGDTNFAELLNKIEAVCKTLQVPVIVKEVGWGISEKTARQLASAGVSAIDVAGSGGTSWSEVEYHRAPTEFHARVARSFADWGIPTAESIQYVKSATSDMTIFASGGLRDGIDVAKSVALGATLGGFAGAFLKAADKSVEAVLDLEQEITKQLRVAMFCVGTKNLAELQQIPLIEAKA